MIGRVFKCIGRLFTGEWMFCGGRPNGGGVIFWRSAWITFFMYVLGLWLRSIFRAGCPACEPDIVHGLLHGNDDTVPTWPGAIFAAVWASLYARFASQWSYLAGVYNQIRQALVRLDTLTDLDEKDKERAIRRRCRRPPPCDQASSDRSYRGR
jgi:hypothetical protein